MSELSKDGRDLANRLDAATGTLLAEVKTLPADLVSWKPAPDVWSIMEILCHVDEFIPYWTGQTLQAIAHPEEQWGRTHADTARLDAVGRADSRSLEDVSNGIKSAARASAATVRELSAADLATEAVSRNPRWGSKPASFIYTDLVVQHVEKHIGQIQRNVKQYERSDL